MDCHTDVIFVLDESVSVGSENFKRMRSFVLELVGTLDIDSGNTRVGVMTYSSDVGTVINMNMHSSVAGLQSAISSLNYSAGATNTAAALAYVRTGMLTSAAGDRSDVPNVVVVLTDGLSTAPTTTQVSISIKFTEVFLSVVEFEIYYDK